MELHKDVTLFIKQIQEIAKEENLAPALIEKDYFVTMLLSALSQKLPTMIFKGGTSLSKCYRVIKRFSEDIDITVEHIGRLTQGQYKKIKQAVVDCSNECGFEILNLNDTRSRRDFNQYKIDYPSEFILTGLKQFIFVETSLSVHSFPTESKPLKSIIQEYLEERGLQYIAERYGLREFSVRTQKLDRTLIDKLFALGDYYLIGKETGHSRHLYDIYKLLPFVTIDDAFKALVTEVREARKVSPYCRSAQSGIDTQKLLCEIADKDAYKKDYEKTLAALLYETVPYDEAKKALLEIISRNIF
jgi:predicted nucleotidyltransferase component of viral defense system